MFFFEKKPVECMHSTVVYIIQNTTTDTAVYTLHVYSCCGCTRRARDGSGQRRERSRGRDESRAEDETRTEQMTRREQSRGRDKSRAEEAAAIAEGEPKPEADAETEEERRRSRAKPAEFRAMNVKCASRNLLGKRAPL